MDIMEHKNEILKLADEMNQFVPLIFRGKEIPKYSISRYGVIMNNEKGVPVAQWVCSYGRYISVNLHIDHVAYKVMVHRLVATAFCPNDDPEHKTEVNHIDGNGHNNIWTNLEWVTHTDNVAHTINAGRNAYGISHPNSKYTEEQIHRVCKMLEDGCSITNIALNTGVNKQIITGIKSGIEWNHISNKYTFPRSKKYIFLKKEDVKLYEMLKSGVEPRLVRDFAIDNNFFPGKSVAQIYAKIKLLRRAIIYNLKPVIIKQK